MSLQVVESIEEVPHFTGERFLPGSGVEIAYDHWSRYAFAQQFAAGRNVLDVASGEGYGAHFLAQAANQVVGFDVDEASVLRARRVYGQNNLNYLHRSMEAFFAEAKPQSFDLVTAFEILEHVDAEQQEAMMRHISRLLAPAGVAVISTPDKTNYGKGRDSHNEFHVRELERAEFEALLRNHFRHVAVLQQLSVTGSVIVADNASSAMLREIEWPDQVARLKSNVSIRGQYLVAVVANDLLPRFQGVVSVDGERRLTYEATYPLKVELEELRGLAGSASRDDRSLRSLNAAVDVLSQRLAATRDLQAARHRLEVELQQLRQRHDTERLHRNHLENMLSVRIAMLIKGRLDRTPRLKEVTRRVLLRLVG
jgi:SAM-dependent methyltransferase